MLMERTESHVCCLLGRTVGRLCCAPHSVSRSRAGLKRENHLRCARVPPSGLSTTVYCPVDDGSASRRVPPCDKSPDRLFYAQPRFVSAHRREPSGTPRNGSP